MTNLFYRNIIYYDRYYLDFFETLDRDLQKKFNWTLQLISTVEKIPTKYFKHISGTNGLYEIRVEFQSNIYRVFCFFDQGNLIVLANGFQKKSVKTPKKEIKLALRIKKQFEDEIKTN
jgi:phage-related protein